MIRVLSGAAEARLDHRSLANRGLLGALAAAGRAAHLGVAPAGESEGAAEERAAEVRAALVTVAIQLNSAAHHAQLGLGPVVRRPRP